MNVKRSILFCIVVLLAVGLAACERNLPAPKSAPTTAVPQEGVPPGTTPGVTDVIDMIYAQATQTAMAQLTGVAPPLDEVPALTEPAPEASAVVPEQPATPVPVEPTAPPTAVPVVDVPPVEVPTSYSLKGGEFPYCIARRYNLDPGELLRANGMSSASMFYAGMTLQIPKNGKPFPGNRSLHAHPTTYIVNAGDTLNKIACYFGAVAPESIAYANSLTAPYKLTPGQVLTIP